MAILEVKNVSKRYKKGQSYFTAVDNVSFEVKSGEVVGFIGPNGAGKSTTIKMITGLAAPSAGSITIDGLDVKKNHSQAIELVGAIIENPDMYVDWTAKENLQYFCSLRKNAKRDRDEKRIDDLIEVVGLKGREKDKVKKYSLGMKQRLGIAQALINEPKLLILDEPANGLDPSGIREIRDIIVHLSHEKGLAILVSSHQLAEMQLTCDRFIIINKGKVVATPTAEELEGHTSDNTLVVLIGTDDVVGARDVLKAKFNIDATLAEGRIEIKTAVPISELTKELILSGININGVTQKAVSLEDYFMTLTNGSAKSDTSIDTKEEK